MCNRHAKWEGAWRDSHAHYGRQGWGPRHERPQHRGQAHPPANIQETDDSYEIFLAAPGRTKEDFRLHIADDVLTIAYEQPEAQAEGQWLRSEYRIAPFQRSFQLNSKVEAGLISARYTDGVLQVTLPKRPEFAGPKQEIMVA